MKNILNFTKKELCLWLDKNKIRSFRADQIFKWLYIKQADSFNQMTDISKQTRSLIKNHFYIERLEIADKKISKDGTQKFLFGLKDGLYIESVLILEKDHYTICVSSQVGCAQNCKFCLTAKKGFKRNLKVFEIISQIRDARFYLTQKNIDSTKLSNIVFMGMGEPLANYNNLIKALTIITDHNYGLKFSPRRVTVSTAGLIPKIKQLGKDSDVNLAISLNAVDNDLRSFLMPVNKKYPLKELLETCKIFPLKPRNRITFEYVIIKDINDKEEDAYALIKLLSKIKSKLNLILFNECDKIDFLRPSQQKANKFLQILLDNKVLAIIRKSKGNDILAACGQLEAKRRSYEQKHCEKN